MDSSRKLNILPYFHKTKYGTLKLNIWNFQRTEKTRRNRRSSEQPKHPMLGRSKNSPIAYNFSGGNVQLHIYFENVQKVQMLVYEIEGREGRLLKAIFWCGNGLLLKKVPKYVDTLIRFCTDTIYKNFEILKMRLNLKS